MYPTNLFSYNEEVNGKPVWFVIIPNFRENVTLSSNKKGLFLSDGEIKIEKYDDDIFSISVSEDAQWLLTDSHYSFFIYITERTKEINTSLGDEWNREFNRMLKICKTQYAQRKKEEIRLYFYNFSTQRLSLVSYENITSPSTQYRLSLPFHDYCAIDQKFSFPTADCFILGRILKTIGTKNAKLIDFIEPVSIIYFDFEKEKYDFGEYNSNKSDLSLVLYKLLEFCIEKEHFYDDVTYFRIKAYIQKEQDDVISVFIQEIWKAFKSRNLPRLRELYNVLTRKQNCDNLKFEIMRKKEMSCPLYETILVTFENKEQSFVSAEWIYEHNDYCTNASTTYVIEKDLIRFY